MLFRLRSTLLLPVAALLGCSSGPSSNMITVPATAATGDYVITVAGGTAQASQFTGALTVTGSSAAGTFRYSNPGAICVAGTQDISFAGTIANGTLTLTSSSFAGSVATLVLPLPFGANTSNQQVSTGTAIIAGGTCALASTTAKGQFVPNIAGNYTGTFSGPVGGTASVSLTELPANSDGQFPATAAVTFTSTANPACSFSVPASAPLSGVVSGTTLQAVDNPKNPTVSINVNASVLPITFSISETFAGTAALACTGTYSGTIN